MILTRNVLWHIAQILKVEMQLTDERVYLFNQKYQLPKDEGLLIAVGMEGVRTFSSTNRFNDGTETQSTLSSAQVWLDLVSRDPSALDRKEEVLMALRSQYAQSMQEKHSFHIAPIPPVPIANLSEIEGSSIPYRFRVMVQVQYLTVKEKGSPYYETYSQSVNARE